MSISSGGTRKAGPYTGNGSTTAFPFAFKVFQPSDVLVVQTDTTPTDYTLVLNTQYTVTLNANQDANPGGTVNMVTAPPLNYLLTIGSNLPQTQSVTLTNNSGFYPTVINNALDYLTILIQQLAEKIGRSLTMPFSTSSSVSTQLPPVSPGSLLGWKADGSGIANTGATGVGAGSIVAANMAAGATGTALSTDTQATLTKATPAANDEIPLFDSANFFYLKSLKWSNLMATIGALLNMTGAVNYARTSVASAATPDIWTATGNNINYTGTATATGFAAAPQAGASRILDCAAACAFTAGANMLIDGVPSGQTLTVAAGDRVSIFARTATQFVLRRLRADGGTPPVGTLLMWPLPTPPAWALARNGAPTSRTTYANLFSVLCPTRNGTTTNASNVVSALSTTADLYIGMPIEGAGIPAGTTIASITSATAITLSQNATASATVPMTLFYYGYGTSGGATTFGLPDDRGVFERGLDTGAAGLDSLTYACANTSGTALITGLTTTANMSVGQTVSGTGVPAGATIAQINSVTSITLSVATTAAVATISVSGNRIGGYSADQFASHTHQEQIYTVGQGWFANGSVYGSSAPASSYMPPTLAAGNNETKPKNRAYLPIIVY